MPVPGARRRPSGVSPRSGCALRVSCTMSSPTAFRRSTCRRAWPRTSWASDLAAYRIIQESLTNVVRHAGRATAEVTLAYEPSRIVIDVSDDGRGLLPGNGEAGGHGIAGIRERVGAAGGGVEAGPRDGRGSRLRAWLRT